MRIHDRRTIVWLGIGPLLWFTCLARAASGQDPGPEAGPILPVRPAAIHLLPSNTVAIVTCADTGVLRERFARSSFYAMTEDPQVRPLISALYGNVVDTMAQLQERLGVRFEELLELAAGELTLAAVAPPQEPPQFALLADVDPLSPHVARLLEELEKWVEDSGGTVTREQVAGMELTVCQPLPGPLDQLVVFRQDESLILTTDERIMRLLMLRWAGVEIDDDPGTLGATQPFVVAMNNTVVEGDVAAQVRWWVDPIDLAFSLAQGRLDIELMLNVLPVLRVDDLQGIGGTVSFDDPLCDQVSELHVFVSPPREGIWEAIATRQGNCEPERWVPGDAASYMTVNLDAAQALRAVTTMVDTLYGEGTVREQMKTGRLAQRLGIDLRTDLWDQLTGHISYATWFEPQASLSAQRSILGFQLRVVERFRPVLEGVVERMEQRLVKESYSGVDFYAVRRNEAGDAAEAGRAGNQDGARLRPARPQPALMLVHDYLVIADQPSALKQAILAATGQVPNLSADEKYKIIAGQLADERRHELAVAQSFSRPEPALRNVYQLVQSAEVQQMLERRARESSFWRSVQQSLQQHPLPPFAVLQQYLAPRGGVWTEVETGWHYLGLALRHENSL
jgi:hypothetical protein